MASLTTVGADDKMSQLSNINNITAHIPFLRRYARALTGTQKAGDAYVAAALESLITEPDMVPEGTDIRVSLYKVFSAIWQSIELNVSESGDTDDDKSENRNLGAIAPKPRQAFLLMALEGFEIPEVAEILNMEESEASELIKQAGAEIADQVATDVLVIEDEPIIAMDIKDIVESLGHKVLGIARTHKEAVAQVKANKPGLVLADIQLADGSSGLEAVQEILEGINVPVVFITAYPERLLTGDRLEPAFLITKPFHPDMIKAVVSQVLFFDTKSGKV